MGTPRKFIIAELSIRKLGFSLVLIIILNLLRPIKKKFCFSSLGLCHNGGGGGAGGHIFF